jgi:hypothetical protein
LSVPFAHSVHAALARFRSVGVLTAAGTAGDIFDFVNYLAEDAACPTSSEPKAAAV